MKRVPTQGTATLARILPQRTDGGKTLNNALRSRERGGATDAESTPIISAIREFCTQRGAAERLRDAAVSSQMATATSEEGLAQNPAPRGRKHKPP